MVGLQGKITGARVMVCLFDPSEIGIIKYRVCIKSKDTHPVHTDLYFQWDRRDKP